jgi:DNA-binding NarL/FixJ family response regulator
MQRRKNPETAREFVVSCGGHFGAPLNEQEKAVLILIGEGDTNLIMCKKLGTTASKMALRISVILAKLGAFNRADAIVKALKRGEIRLEDFSVQ